MFCPKCGNQNPDEARFCRSCRANLTNVLALVDGELGLESGSPKAVDPVELNSIGIRNVVFGLGGLLLSTMLFFVSEKSFYWLLLVFPSLIAFALGVSSIVKSHALSRRKATGYIGPSLTGNIAAAQLNSGKQDYIHPESKFVTNDLAKVPASVTEETTHQLELNPEGETMTLPKK